MVLAIADGHGSAKHFRSHVGARLAVRIAIHILDERPVPEAAECFQSEEWRRDFVNRWIGRVKEDLDDHPFTEEELASVGQQAGQGGVADVQERAEVAYGCTFLGVVVCRNHLVFLQIGDGDVLMVDESGRVSKPIPDDERCIGNATTSMCMADAWSALRVTVRAPTEMPPELVLVSTDGYANSYKSESDFEKVARDIWKGVREEGVDAIARQLPLWLEETTRRGCGDDITLGLLCRGSAQVEATPVTVSADRGERVSRAHTAIRALSLLALTVLIAWGTRFVPGMDGGVQSYRPQGTNDRRSAEICSERIPGLLREYPTCGALLALESQGILADFSGWSTDWEHHIVRAEFTKLVLVARGETPEPGLAGPFPDAGDHWVTTDGYLQKAAQLQIVEGYPDGTFRPQDLITTAEALKMVVASLDRSAGRPDDNKAGVSVWFDSWLLEARNRELAGQHAAFPVEADAELARRPLTRGTAARILANLLEATKNRRGSYDRGTTQQPA